MELLNALLTISLIIGAIGGDVYMTHGLNRRYYQLVCRVPIGPLRLAALPSPGRPLHGESLVIGVSSEGLQVRSTRKKHHLLLRVAADGHARVGAPVSIWLCLLGWLTGAGVMVVAATHHPLRDAAIMVTVSVLIVAAFGRMLQLRARQMVADTERVIAAQLVEERLREIR